MGLFAPRIGANGYKKNRHLLRVDACFTVIPASYHIISRAACWARALWAAFILPKFHFTPNRT